MDAGSGGTILFNLALVGSILSNKNLICLLLIIIPASIIFKGMIDNENAKFLTVSHFDTLGSGGLIALLLKEKKDYVGLIINKWKALLIISALIILAIGSYFEVHILFISITVLALSLGLVVGCYYRFSGLFGICSAIPN